MKYNEMQVDANGIVCGGKTPKGDPELWQIEICKRFFNLCVPVKHPKRFSYGLKHEIENWAETYVSNGACICAAIEAGLTIKAIPNSPNAYIGVALHGMGTRSKAPVARD
jgi:hypothetical protein